MAFVETCPLCNPNQYSGRLCAECSRDYEHWESANMRQAAALEALTPTQYDVWLAEQDAEHAARSHATLHTRLHTEGRAPA